MTYRTSLKVRFGDEDHARIVYFPRFLHFFHCAFEDFFGDHGHPYRKVLDDDGFGWPAVHVDVDFQSPLRFGDVFDIDVWVEKVGQKSATFRYRGRCEGRNVATATIVVACIDMRKFVGVPIPEPYRTLFENNQTPPSD
jgi:4-hydroxybenzoyl-CoA thioesterase